MVYKMGQTNVQEVFFENPSRVYHIREIARILNASKTAVGYHIKRMGREGIVVSKKGVFTGYAANESSQKYRFAKLLHALKRIEDSGLADFLDAHASPR